MPWPVGLPCIVCDGACDSTLDFWETPDDAQTNAIHMRCQDWLLSADDPLGALRRLQFAKRAEARKTLLGRMVDGALVVAVDHLRLQAILSDDRVVTMEWARDRLDSERVE